MQPIIQYSILALAVYRLAVLIAKEDGPFDVCLRSRQWVHRRFPGQQVVIMGGINPVYGENPSWIVRGVNCPNCVSFWLAFVAALLVWPGWLWYVPLALALASVTVILNRG